VNTVITWLVVILMLFVFVSLGLALKYLIFKQPTATEKTDELKAEKRVVSLLTLRVVFSAILLILCYLYLSSLK